MRIETRDLQIEVKSVDDVFKEADEVLKAVKEGKHLEYEGKKIVFPSLDMLRKFLTPERIRMLHIIRKHKPSSIYALAILLKKDRRNVLKDLHFLHSWGFVKVRKEPKPQTGRKTIVPYVDFSKIVVGIPI